MDGFTCRICIRSFPPIRFETVRFVLVHGGFHGAWCWDKLVPELEAFGHEALAIDLPGSGERLEEKANHASWRAAFRDVVEDGDVLVGHSQGGFAISLAADELPEKSRPTGIPSGRCTHRRRSDGGRHLWQH